MIPLSNIFDQGVTLVVTIISIYLTYILNTQRSEKKRAEIEQKEIDKEQKKEQEKLKEQQNKIINATTEINFSVKNIEKNLEKQDDKNRQIYQNKEDIISLNHRVDLLEEKANNEIDR